MLDKVRELLRPFYLRNIYFPLFPHRKPPYFTDCWKYPAFEPQSLGPGRTLVLFLPMNDWHTRMQRTQHLALGLSRRGYVCAYLNPHLGREFPGGPGGGPETRVTQLHPGLLELHVHLPREPVFHHRMLTGAESNRIAEAAAKLIQQVRPSRVVQVLAFPVWLPAARLLRDRHRAPLVYDCHDYLPGFSRISPEIIREEPETFRASDLVVCSSDGLAERAESFSPRRPVLIRNAAAAELLDVPRAPGVPVTVGYIGALDSWFDIPSVRAAAQAHPEWRFPIVGRVENEQVRQLASLPNVNFLGELPFGELGTHLSTFTVGTIPFLPNSLIAATDPIKVYEYLAAGLAVVASDLPELRRFGSLVSRYRDPADFVRRLEAAVAQESAALVAERRSRAREETWDRRVDQLAAELEALTGHSRKPSY